MCRAAVLFACCVCAVATAQQQPRPNRVVDVISSCDRATFAVRLVFEQPFKGKVFSKDFSRECQVQGNLQKQVSLTLPSNACGVRTSPLNTTSADQQPTSSDQQSTSADQQLTSADPQLRISGDQLYYSVELVVQMDKHLQQSSDQEIFISCKLQPRVVRINSSALEGIIENKLREMSRNDIKKIRTGRRRQGFLSPLESAQRELVMSSPRAWMELAPAQGSAPAVAEPATVEVGQPTRLVIQCTLPVGVGLRVTDCVAHDGLGEASQKLLDSAGCPVDESIFSRPTTHQRPQPRPSHDPDLSGLMTSQRAVTTFAAFKFPDRAKLHLTCGVELCRGRCPQVDCAALQRGRRPRLDEGHRGNVIDRLEVYNSIQVLAPNIELEDEASIRGSRRIESEEEELVRGFSPGDKTICLSPGKMALAFCVLGVIFVCAIGVALVSLVRARRRMRSHRGHAHATLSLYTPSKGSKSLFSSSQSESSGLSGSKLLLTDSPLFDHHSSSTNNWPYSRAF